MGRYRIEVFPHVNPDGLARGNACLNASGVDLFQAHTHAAWGEFAAGEARLIWSQATSAPLGCALDFHCFMGGYYHQDKPGEGSYVIAGSEQVVSARAADTNRLINDRVIFSTDAFSSRYRPSDLAECSLCHRLARQRDVPSIFLRVHRRVQRAAPKRENRHRRPLLATMRGPDKARC